MMTGFGISISIQPRDNFMDYNAPVARTSERYGACEGYNAPSHRSEPCLPGDGPRTFVEWFTWLWGEDHRDYRERKAWEAQQAQAYHRSTICPPASTQPIHALNMPKAK